MEDDRAGRERAAALISRAGEIIIPEQPDVCGLGGRRVNLNSLCAKEPMEGSLLHSRPVHEKLAGLALLWRLRMCRSRCTRGAWLHPGLDVGDRKAQALYFSLSTSPRANSFQHPRPARCSG